VRKHLQAAAHDSSGYGFHMPFGGEKKVAGRSKINPLGIVANHSNTVEGDRAKRAVRQPRSAEGNVLAIPSGKAENQGIVAVSVGVRSKAEPLLTTV